MAPRCGLFLREELASSSFREIFFEILSSAISFLYFLFQAEQGRVHDRGGLVEPLCAIHIGAHRVLFFRPKIS
ncbi:hypothetical protein Taro_000667 [Colocasia esculenta]|uniref:Uncharacterized protein n=1 Tax=Colocasia esculenta TaxID=4460 RepID=A0A843TBG9_COLES|nr:hypothetical protein [Colocasia esculenta]